jgi:hypothetical protein
VCRRAATQGPCCCDFDGGLGKGRATELTKPCRLVRIWRGCSVGPDLRRKAELEAVRITPGNATWCGGLGPVRTGVVVRLQIIDSWVTPVDEDAFTALSSSACVTYQGELKCCIHAPTALPVSQVRQPELPELESRPSPTTSVEGMYRAWSMLWMRHLLVIRWLACVDGFCWPGRGWTDVSGQAGRFARESLPQTRGTGCSAKSCNWLKKSSGRA